MGMFFFGVIVGAIGLIVAAMISNEVQNKKNKK